MSFSRYEENLIANLRGLPECKARASFSEQGRPYNPRNLREVNEVQPPRSAQPLAAVLDQVIERYKLQEIRPERILVEHWEDIVGSGNAAHCMPKKIQRKYELIIAVPDPVERSNLHFQRSQILHRLRQWPGLEHIKRIRLVG